MIAIPKNDIVEEGVKQSSGRSCKILNGKYGEK